MPTYTFYDEKSGIEWTESLSIAERTKFLDDNKQIRQTSVPDTHSTFYPNIKLN